MRIVRITFLLSSSFFSISAKNFFWFCFVLFNCFDSNQILNNKHAHHFYHHHHLASSSWSICAHPNTHFFYYATNKYKNIENSRGFFPISGSFIFSHFSSYSLSPSLSRQHTHTHTHTHTEFVAMIKPKNRKFNSKKIFLLKGILSFHWQ